jgi:Carboxypeptidase regulatory-like domain
MPFAFSGTGPSSHPEFTRQAAEGDTMGAFRVALARQHAVVVCARRYYPALIVGLTLMAAGCGADIPTAPIALQQVGTFEGVVADSQTGQPLGEVRVEATAGAGAGRVTLTNGSGLFTFELAPGTTHFRWSRAGYDSYDAEYTVAVGAKTETQVVLRRTASSSPIPPPPYTFTGLVTDSRRNPVSGAEVWIYSNGSPIDDRRGTGFTDASGHYAIVSERLAASARAQKLGYLLSDVSIGPPSSGTTFITNLTIKRYERYTVIGPGSIAVGEDARLLADLDLDDGSRLTGSYFSTVVSSNPSVLVVDPAAYTGRIRGVGPGSATVTATFSGLSSAVEIRVDR